MKLKSILFTCTALGLAWVLYWTFAKEIWAQTHPVPRTKTARINPDSLVPFRPGLKTIEDPYTKFDRLTTADGLTSNEILSLYEDKLGYIWIGTIDGLNRYDGYTVVPYKHSDNEPTSLPGNWITGLAEDPMGTLWISTRSGLCSYSRQTGAFRPCPNPYLASAFVAAIYAAPDSILWALTNNAVLVKYRPKTNSTEMFNLGGHAYISNYYNSITPYGSNELIVGGETCSFTYLFNTQTGKHTYTHWEKFLGRPGMNASDSTQYHRDLSCFHTDAYRNEYICTGHHFNYYRTPKQRKWTFMTTHSSLYAMANAPDGSLWYGGFAGGLYHYNILTNTQTRYGSSPSNPRSLSSNQVRSLLQQASGTLFIGTGYGVSILRKKPNRIAHFRKIQDRANSPSSNKINCLYADDSVLWIGNQETGFDSYHYKSKAFKNYLLHQDGKVNPRGASVVERIKKANNGNLILGYWTGLGFSEFNPATGKATLITLPKNLDPSLNSSWIKDIAIMPSRPNPWLVYWGNSVAEYDIQQQEISGLGFYVLNNHNVAGGQAWHNSFSFDEKLGHGGTLHDIQKDEVHWPIFWDNWYNYLVRNTPMLKNRKPNATIDRGVFVGSLVSNHTQWELFTYGLYKITDSLTGKEIPNLNDEFFALSHTLSQTHLALLGKKGIHLFDIQTEKDAIYPHPSLFADYGKGIFPHTENSYWVAGEKGIAHALLTNGKVELLTAQIKGLENLKGIKRIEQLNQHELLCYSGAKVFSFSPKSKTAKEIPILSGLKDIEINHISVGNTFLLVSTTNGLLYYDLKNQKTTHYKANPANQYAIKSNTVYHSSISPKGQMLVTTDKGACLFDYKTQRFIRNPFNARYGHQFDLLSAIEPENDSILWGGGDRGIVRLNILNGRTTSYMYQTWNPASLISDNVFSLFVDKNKTLWVGTDKGLDCLQPDGKTFRHYTAAQGLKSLPINAITQDHSGNIWMGTTDGIAKLDPHFNIITHYNATVGLQTAEFKSITTLPDGRIAAAGWEGLNIFHPDSLRPSAYEAKAMVFNLKINDSLRYAVFSETNTLELSYSENNLAFELASTDHNSPLETQYAYKLEGYDKEWIYTTADIRAVRYTNLPAGEYKLRIKLTNADGLWNEAGFVSTLIIHPPFWLRWWFWLLCVAALIAIVYFIIQWRLAQVRRENQLLEEKVTLRTQQLKQSKEEVEQASKEILDSIHYARKIQEALLPANLVIKKMLPETFLLFKPKDIVSGDFYWVTEHQNQVWIALVDCTGHGVPGAFMSIIANNLLQKFVVETNAQTPAEALNKISREVARLQSSDDPEKRINDTFEIALVAINRKTSVLEFSGAKIGLMMVSPQGLTETKGDRMYMGNYGGQIGDNFTNHRIAIQPETMVYITSDGFATMIGNASAQKPHGETLKAKRFREVFTEIATLPVEEQKLRLNDFHKDWVGNLEQNDDITVIGIRF